MTTISQDTAIAFALASYARLETVSEPVVIRNVEPRQSLVKVRATKGHRTVKVQPQVAQPAVVESVPQPTNPSPNGKVAAVKLPEPGTLSAKGYIMMMNRAKSRDEKIAAIAGFIGYNNSLSFGENEMAANQAAKGATRPISVTGPTREEKRAAQISAKGYVAGMPDAQAKIIGNLIGREQYAVDERTRLETEQKRTDLSPAERQLNDGLIQLEEARLVEIRAELAQLIG